MYLDRKLTKHDAFTVPVEKHDATVKIHFTSKSKSFIDSIRVALSIVCRVGREITFSIDFRR